MLKDSNTATVMIVILFCVTVAPAGAVTFTPLTHGDNVGLLPQSKGIMGQSGDHLARTADDLATSTWNPQGCFSFNFTNPYGESMPDYPAGYTEGIHSMVGAIDLDVDLSAGGAVTISSLYLHGQAKYAASGDKYAYQHLVESADPAAGGGYGPIDGIGNSGSYAASAQSNWAFSAGVDWYYDTPSAGSGNIDMTFDDFQWTGFIIPVSQLNPSGMSAVSLDDPLGLFGGSSEDFESWLVDEVACRLPASAEYLLFVQGEAKPDWSNPGMQGWDPANGILGEAILAYAIPEPTTGALLAGGLFAWFARRRIRRTYQA